MLIDVQLRVGKTWVRKGNLGKGTAIYQRTVLFNKHFLMADNLALSYMVMHQQVIF
jgi:hypothetical protein